MSDSAAAVAAPVEAAPGCPSPEARPVELLSEETIAARVLELAEEIAAAAGDSPLHLVVVLRGAFVFAADLVRALDRVGVEVTVGFCRIASYGDGTTPGKPRLELPSPESLHGRDVLIVEDIVDTGVAFDALLPGLAGFGPRSLRTVALLSKPSRRRIGVPIDHVGFLIPDRFVVGYGLDHAGRYRQLPFIGVVSRD